jgi:hypothetical protein
MPIVMVPISGWPSHCFYFNFTLFIRIWQLCIVIFTHMLTMYLSWSHPFHHSPSSPYPPSYNRFNGFHSSILTYGYKIHPPYSPSFLLSLYLLSPTGTTPRKDLLYPPVLDFSTLHEMLISIGQFSSWRLRRLFSLWGKAEMRNGRTTSLLKPPTEP